MVLPYSRTVHSFTWVLDRGQPEGTTLQQLQLGPGGLLAVLTFPSSGVAGMGGKEASPVTEQHRVPATRVAVAPRVSVIQRSPLASRSAGYRRSGLDVVFITVRHGFAKIEG